MGALSNKGGRGQTNREEIGAEATFSRNFFSRLRRSFSRASRANFAAAPLLRPARQNRHGTQASDTPVQQLRGLFSMEGEFEQIITRIRLSIKENND